MRKTRTPVFYCSPPQGNPAVHPARGQVPRLVRNGGNLSYGAERPEAFFGKRSLDLNCFPPKREPAGTMPAGARRIIQKDGLSDIAGGRIPLTFKIRHKSVMKTGLRCLALNKGPFPFRCRRPASAVSRGYRSYPSGDILVPIPI